jgi:hypothetical protein
MTPTEILLPRLERVRQRGANQWSACCPAHGDRSPSLSVKELSDGRVLLHCFAGCSFEEVVSAIGLSINDLLLQQAPNTWSRGRRERLITPSQGLEIVASESLIVAVQATDIACGRRPEPDEIDRLWLAAGRINAVYQEVAR